MAPQFARVWAHRRQRATQRRTSVLRPEPDDPTAQTVPSGATATPDRTERGGLGGRIVLQFSYIQCSTSGREGRPLSPTAQASPPESTVTPKSAPEPRNAGPICCQLDPSQCSTSGPTSVPLVEEDHPTAHAS